MNSYERQEQKEQQNSAFGCFFVIVVIISLIITFIIKDSGPIKQDQNLVERAKFQIISLANVGRYSKAGVTAININDKNDIRNICIEKSTYNTVNIEVDQNNMIGSYLYYEKYNTFVDEYTYINIKSN
jgi:hypothetical protein